MYNIINLLFNVIVVVCGRGGTPCFDGYLIVAFRKRSRSAIGHRVTVRVDLIQYY